MLQGLFLALSRANELIIYQADPALSVQTMAFILHITIQNTLKKKGFMSVLGPHLQWYEG